MTLRSMKASANNSVATTASVPDSTIRAETYSVVLNEMSAEIVDLFYAHIFSPGAFATESSVCRAFSDIILRRWDVRCLITFLRDDGNEGHLCETAMHKRPSLDEVAMRRISESLARTVEREGREWQFELTDDAAAARDSRLSDEARRLLAETRLAAGVAIPIHAHGTLIGALVALAEEPETLREALLGVRRIAAPLVIALGDVRRAKAMYEQRQRIERLVEELQRRGGALEEANRELQHVGRYRSLFLARMSHELRTPLTSIFGFVEILLDHEQLTDTQRRFCEKIQASGRQLHTSLNQLVDLSRLEAGQTELFLHEFSLREMLRESCAAVGRLAQKQHVKIECVTAPDLSAIVSDEGKLRQVLYNFLTHAISRSPADGQVFVRVYRSESDDFNLEISDEGEPLRDPAHLFNPVNLDVPSESGTNMNELGLVIAHRLVSALGGSVALDTAAPRGLVIRLKLPARPMEK